MYKDGHELIEKMPKKHDPWWGIDDLKQHIKDTSPEHPWMNFLDPKHNKYCIEVDGRFSIAEIEAILIAMVNDRGRFEAQ